MICADDISLHRQRKPGLCTHDEPDRGLQTSRSRHDQVFGSWHHRKVIPFCLRWKPRAERLGLIIIFVISVLVVLVIWVSQTALAAFTSDSFLFASIGDFGSGTQNQHMVAHQMAMFATEHQIKFVTGLGDNFYESGIRNLDDSQLVEKFEEVYKDSYLTTIPWFVALGDHDHCGNISAQVEYSHRSPIWRMPAPYFVKHIREGQGLTLDLIVTDSIGLEV
ncbi:hypothetical protein M758_6G046700 [Ceratodon purpureus]|nr:hypothetical protein M758_6G046700 [Ceratodon purpureus]